MKKPGAVTAPRRYAIADIAARGFDFLYEHVRDDAGRYCFALNREGVPYMTPYSLFSDCFAAMGAARLYKITGKERFAEAARRMRKIAGESR